MCVLDVYLSQSLGSQGLFSRQDRFVSFLSHREIVVRTSVGPSTGETSDLRPRRHYGRSETPCRGWVRGKVPALQVSPSQVKTDLAHATTGAVSRGLSYVDSHMTGTRRPEFPPSESGRFLVPESVRLLCLVDPGLCPITLPDPDSVLT